MMQNSSDSFLHPPNESSAISVTNVNSVVVQNGEDHTPFQRGTFADDVSGTVYHIKRVPVGVLTCIEIYLRDTIIFIKEQFWGAFSDMSMQTMLCHRNVHFP